MFTLRNTVNEYCVALDATRGTQLWTTALGPPMAYSTPTFKDGRVYAYSGTMKLFCLDATNGGILWQRDMTNEFGSRPIEYGNSQSPWVEDGRVFVSILAPTNCLLAFNATNGALLWCGYTNVLTYGSPVGATIHATRQIIFPDPWGLVSVAPEDGRLLWRLEHGYSPGRHGPSPIVSGDIVVCVKSDPAGAKAFRVLETNGVLSTLTLWTNAKLSGTYVTAVVHEGYLYSAFDYALQCLELASGQVRWRTNFYYSPSVILADNQLLLLDEGGGDLKLAKASPLRYEQLARCTVPDTDYLNSPAFSNGRIYIRCPYRIVCLDAAPPAPLEMRTAPVPGGTKVRLTVSCRGGGPIATNRLPYIYVRWSPALDLPAAQWPAWYGGLAYLNGVLYGEALLSRTDPAQFFIAVESKESSPLEMAALPLPGGAQLRLTVRCKDGSPIRMDRIPRIRFAWSPNLATPPELWSAWTGALVYTNGGLYSDGPLPRNQPARYFIAVEGP